MIPNYLFNARHLSINMYSTYDKECLKAPRLTLLGCNFAEGLTNQAVNSVNDVNINALQMQVLIDRGLNQTTIS
jgi:hypothetical protein